MLTHDYIFIGLLSVLFFFKRSRYASAIYLPAYLIYLSLYSNGLIPESYYHASSATFNLFIFMALFRDYKYKGLDNIFNFHNYNINQLVGVLSLLLIFVNLSGYCYWVKDYNLPPTIYNSDYRFIVAVQITLLYIGNMLNAWADRADYKRAMVRFTHYDSCEIHSEYMQEEGQES